MRERRASERLDEEISRGSKMRFSPIFSSFLLAIVARIWNGCATRSFFENISVPVSLLADTSCLLRSGWTMVTYVSIYKSRIVRSPMFSRPHINPGGEGPCTRVLFNGWPLSLQRDPRFLIYQVTSVRNRSHAAKCREFVDYPARTNAPQSRNTRTQSGPSSSLCCLTLISEHRDWSWPVQLHDCIFILRIIAFLVFYIYMYIFFFIFLFSSLSAFRQFIEELRLPTNYPPCICVRCMCEMKCDTRLHEKRKGVERRKRCEPPILFHTESIKSREEKRWEEKSQG